MTGPSTQQSSVRNVPDFGKAVHLTIFWANSATFFC